MENQNKMKKIKNNNSLKIILLILDGWGLGEPSAGNAIALAKTPFIDSLYKKYPWTKLCATGEFFKNPAFIAALNHVKKENSTLHLMGMLSNDQSPHSDPDHLLALLSLARHHKIKNIYLHLFTDGRDSPPRSSLKAVEALERNLRPNEIIATIIGRFYAMDRKKNWASTWWAYETMTTGKGHKAKSPQEGITRAYNAGITDEFIEPIVLYQKNKMIKRISNNDAIIFFNLRSDRARQMAKPFIQKEFEKKNPQALKRQKVLK